ncbi:hypothetical protein [Spirosoma pollinicola]|uniref:Uncharacterized protein n=1 Tax=Spirosoma pollinicola TaxID=2057025 RepID=A0A2K8ZC64_9BACT|nr:hypothetical protein [Spirosoma pollinicola]AUD07467.1 hypothetical protein CWM47_24520 [Spirosoma pollinicola]
MKNIITGCVAALCLCLSSCHRPVAYFQPTPHPAATRQPIEQPVAQVKASLSDSAPADTLLSTVEKTAIPAVASLSSQPAQTTNSKIERRMHRMQSLLSGPSTQTNDQQPGPKPKKKLKLGNQIRQGLGMPLRPELNWWQRISWKLKASVLVILVAVLFAILHITILAIIFGILGAFLLITGLKRSFKVRRPWF